MSESVAKRRLLFTLGDLDSPEAGRVAAVLLEHLSPDRFEPHLALLDEDPGSLSQLSPHVALHHLGTGRTRQAERSLRTLVERLEPHVVFSLCFELGRMMLRQRGHLAPDVRIVVREASISDLGAGMQRVMWPGSRRSRRLYRRADRVICPWDFMLEDLHARFQIPRDRMVRICDPIDVNALRERAREGTNPFAARGLGPHVLAAGANSFGRGFDQLLHALPALARQFPGAQLWIIGNDESPERARAQELRALAGELELEERLHLMGPRGDFERWLHHADLFVLPSQDRGTPEVLLQALACGCPVIALDSPGSTREVMERTGLLDRLVSELDWRREWFRTSPGHEMEADLSAFEIGRVLDAYKQVFVSV